MSPTANTPKERVNNIEIYINKDIGSFHAPFIGPFTFRQVICICIAAPVCWAVYHWLSPYISPDTAGCLVMIPAAGAWAFGWLRPFGMPMEKYLQSIYISTILAPSVRKYRIEAPFEEILKRQDDGSQKAHGKKYRVSKEAVC